ncbi:uncharacterized protein BJ171DRAFT_626498 [Polychytrium aggregatum]|uniref:uncharacterized protein n=1 Tax=Polychytrium aggregatum TaxID=110093 RepID=UPI0022FDC101|nr:uncharacterized protein BJ171DRAFT_626498 [Polychytrium aggregatum]KAI9202750.1 hypothetical protein BJ171DRAFT_626498 [Polychytrium aggregatum]
MLDSTESGSSLDIASGFDALPYEVVLAIIHYLPLIDQVTVQRVSRRFSQVSNDSMLWRKISLEPFRSIVDDTTLGILGRTRFASIDPEIGAGRLMDLDLSGCKITDWGVIAISERCQRLRSLNLQWLDEITDLACDALARHCKELSSLNLKWCTNVSDKGIQHLARSLRQLETLVLCCNPSLTDDALEYLAGGLTRWSLRRLRLSLCDSITADGLRNLEQMPRLTYVDVALCTSVSADSIDSLTDLGILVDHEGT